MMRRSILWAAALLLAVSCGGGAPVSNEPADLSAFKGNDGLYSIPVKGETIQLVEMPAGTFAMGETLDMGRYRTPSIHQVILDGYAIGTTEVSQALWKAVMGSNPSPKDVPTAPVTSVTYNDVQKFLKKLSKATGVPFRLPTEAEWEYAARQRDDMPGGAWEWCSDFWTDDLGYHLAINPQGPAEGAEYALRGGSALEKDCKPITRKGMAPTSKAGDVGLRLAVSIDAPYPQELKDVLVDNKIPREHFETADLKPETITVNGVKFDMMPVEGGTFLMGATIKITTSRDDEFPPHEVTLDHFKMGKYEVTQALWEAVMGSVPYGNQGPNYPVGNVSWYDVQAFIRQLNALTGRKFRLPTEAEWEYAAKGGKKSHGYAFAGSPFPQGVAQYGYDDMRTRPVARYSPNELGLYDMSGNAWEWCQDRPTRYTEEAQTNPVGRDFQPGENDLRVMRGGSVATTPDKCRVTNRNEFEPSRFRSTIGFRLVL